MAKYLGRKPTNSASLPTDVDGEITGLLRPFPAIAEYMSAAKDSDGKARETATLLVFCEEGRWKARFLDRQSGECLWQAATTFQALLEGLEEHLESGTGEWQPVQQKRR